MSLTSNGVAYFTVANAVNIVHKLVTIFAGHLDSLIMINNLFDRLKTTVTSGSGQISLQITLISFARTGKNCAILACHWDSSIAHNRDNQPVDCAG